jgi:hypothetical protein
MLTAIKAPAEIKALVAVTANESLPDLIWSWQRGTRSGNPDFAGGIRVLAIRRQQEFY